MLKSPDPILPLIEPADPVAFSRKRISGNVFAQRYAPKSEKLHPTLFYVEWPADSGHFYEVCAAKAVGILAERLTGGHFNRALVARIMEKAAPGFPFPAFLTACRP